MLPPSGLRPSHSPSPFCMFHKDTSKRFVVILRTNKLRSYNVKETRRSAIAEKMRGSTNAHKTHALHVYYVTINNVLRPTRLDYCNAVFAGLPKDTIAPLQRVQNAAARLILGLAPHDHVTAALRHLHLPVQYRITYKLCPLMHLIHIHKSPSYFKDTVTPSASVNSRGWLRSASSSHYEQPWMRLKFRQCCFSYAAPDAWNTLPPSLQQLTNTDSFKRQLKTVFF